MPDNYLYYDTSTVMAGILHNMRNLKVLLREAYILDRIAIIPEFNFLPLHNHGNSISNYLEPYLELEQTTIKGRQLKIVLKEKYDLYRWYDLPPIKAAVKTRPDDNCFLFFIERLLWADAKLKIATHKPGYAGSDIILYPACLVRLSQYCNQWKRSIKAGLDWLRQ